jgi:hypothetical protein
VEYRSTNALGKYVHFGGSVIAGADMGSGVEISATSSGSSPVIAPVGDESNKSLVLAGKGTGGVQIGSSGSAIPEIRKFTVQFTAPVLSSGTATGIESTYTVAGVSTGTVLVFTPTNPINAKYNARPRCSTVDELTIAWSHDGTSTLGSGESTNRGVLLQFK